VDKKKKRSKEKTSERHFKTGPFNKTSNQTGKKRKRKTPVKAPTKVCPGPIVIKSNNAQPANKRGGGKAKRETHCSHVCGHEKTAGKKVVHLRKRKSTNKNLRCR